MRAVCISIAISASLSLLTTRMAYAQDPAPPAASHRVHCVCDISQEFSFYMDGRFFRQYLEGHGEDARNWGSLSELDLSNANLLVLTGGDAHVPYGDAATQKVDSFLTNGGAVLMLLQDAAAPGNAVTKKHGCVASEEASGPAKATQDLLAIAGAKSIEVTFRGGPRLALDGAWTSLVVDADARPLLAMRAIDKGTLLVGSRGLFGSNPDASDPINASWITPLLLHATAKLRVDADKPHRSTWAEDTLELGPLTLEFHDGTAPYARAIADEYAAIRPHLVAITGVEPSPGMIKRLLALPTGGGGFSSGERIAIGAWWGDYPKTRYPMVELIGHEAGHSWVLPHPEPLWNEPIATWLGIEVGRRMGLKDADETIRRQIALARRHDPKFDKVDPLSPNAHRDLVWGKSFFVFEELEKKHGPGAMAKYFRTKRELLKADRPRYTFDDLVAVWSRAVGENLFPWFQSLGFVVREERTGIAVR
ncbi:MAG: hypothetical protein RLZZ562_787 [Planctomycetota bacterium]